MKRQTTRLPLTQPQKLGLMSCLGSVAKIGFVAPVERSFTTIYDCSPSTAIISRDFESGDSVTLTRRGPWNHSSSETGSAAAAAASNRPANNPENVVCVCMALLLPQHAALRHSHRLADAQLLEDGH